MTPYLQQRALLFQPLPRKPSSQLGLVIVIAACGEAQLLRSLMALHRCALPDGDVDILVVIYDSEADPPALRALNLTIGADAERWAARINSTRRWFHIMYHCGMPRRDAGPELALKIGMDEACRRLEQAGNAQGIIASLNAGSRCTINFLVELEQLFQLKPPCPACSIYFEYPLNGAEYPEDTYFAAANHELSLRYFIEVQRYAGYPYAFLTQGPGMAVRCHTYQQTGGLNMKPAEKGLSFLNRFTDSPYFVQLNTTCIYASPQPYSRLTNPKIQSPLTPSQGPVKTHAFQSFEDLRQLFQNTHLLVEKNFDELPLSVALLDFGKKVNALSTISELRSKAPEPLSFQRSFFAWFNHAMIQKFAYFARDHYYPDMLLTSACEALLIAQRAVITTDTFAMLHHFRQRDKKPYTSNET